MIVAPHPDDESLGAGSFIYRSSKSGDEVRIVLMTTGDGFVQDAERYYLSLHVEAQEYLHLGYERQLEVQRAMNKLEVGSDKIQCLGFPDGGLDHLLLHFDASEPFVSQTTQECSVPYINIPTYQTPYGGQNLLRLLLKELKEFRPDWLISPVLVDQHPDHWATSAFATLALLQCQAEGLSWADKTQHYGYLIHWTGWPLPLGYHPESQMEIPPALKGYPFLHWNDERYGEREIQAKRHALLEHDSQVELIKPFLQAFARRNEIFARVTPLPLGPRTVFPRPKADTLAKLLHKDFGLIGSEWWFDGIHLHVVLDVNIRSSWGIRLAIFAIGDDIQFFAVDAKNTSSNRVALREDSVEFSWPWRARPGMDRRYYVMGAVVHDETGKVITRTGFWPWSHWKT